MRTRVGALKRRRPASVVRVLEHFGHAELATTQIYASALSARRRAAVMALDFAAARS